MKSEQAFIRFHLPLQEAKTRARRGKSSLGKAFICFRLPLQEVKTRARRGKYSRRSLSSAPIYLSNKPPKTQREVILIGTQNIYYTSRNILPSTAKKRPGFTA